MTEDNTGTTNISSHTSCDNDLYEAARQSLAAYMEDSNDDVTSLLDSCHRMHCCEKSRFLYCPECCRLLVPPSDMPTAFPQPLPFHIHIILDDKRTSSTGVQLMSIFAGMANPESESGDPANDNQPSSAAQLFDLERNDPVPPYEADNYPEGTYLLFPGDDSVLLSSVLKEQQDDNAEPTKLPALTTLVVLDCKWSSPSAIRLHPSIAALPKVSLDCPPADSYFWRWHNTGAGMLSTIEAIYFAAWQIASHKGWTLDECQTLVRLLWLFRLQRAVIQQRYQAKQVKTVNPYAPFTDEGKEFARKLRQQQKKKKCKENNSGTRDVASQVIS